MTGKTHLAFALAVSCAGLRPATLGGCFGAVAGAALGSVICDIDRQPSGSRRSQQIISLTALGLAAAAFAADAATGRALINSIFVGAGALQVIGLGLFLTISLIGAATAHRSFMHSLTGLLMLGGTMYLAARPLGAPFMIAYGTHLALDLTNRRGLPLLFPLKKRWCMRLFRADGVVDRLIFIASLLAAAALLALYITQASVI